MCVRALLRLHTAVWGWRGLYLTCKVFGTLEYWINYKRRARVRRMIETVFGGELNSADCRRWTRRHFMRQRCDKAFYLIFDVLSTKKIHARFEITNKHLLEGAIARGNGAYVMLCHHGAHHIAGLILSSLGYQVGGVRDPNEGGLRRYFQDMWERKHPELPRIKFVYSGDFARGIYRMFRGNYAVGTALDATRKRHERMRTVPVDIFGQTSEFLTGTLQIAIRCKAVVVQAFIVADDDFRYRLELIGPMTDADADEETPELLRSVMQRYADNIATYARQHPDQITRVSGGVAPSKAN